MFERRIAPVEEQNENKQLSRLISERAAELRLAWRGSAQFDDVAVMLITGRGQQMLLSLSARLESGSAEQIRKLLASPPWTGNEGEADAPLSLLVSLGDTLKGLVADRPELAHAVKKLIGQLAASIDSVQREKVRHLEERVATDALTGAMSRLAIMEHLETECARARRYGRPMSVVFMDVDGLKSTNDELGHNAGDDLLRKLVASVTRNTRSADLFGRLGGDEFLLVLPETDSVGAEAVAAKVRGFLVEEGLNATCGTAGTPQTEPEPERLVETADDAMRAFRRVARG